MIIYTTTEHEVLTRPSVVALGTFDGLHLGHLSVIEHMLQYGKAHDLNKVVFTFSDVPKQVFQSTTSKIMSNVEKLQWLEQMGVDIVVSLPFDQHIRNVTHQAFFDCIRRQLNTTAFVVGENFKFGKAALGTTEWLKEKCLSENCNCIIMPPITHNGKTISSTTIRELLSDGNIVAANRLLGRRHFVSGTVKVGKQLGKKMGFATANMTTCDYMTNIKSGVYITVTKLNDRLYNSVSNVGYNPTFGQTDFNLETHILDFDQSLYGQTISVYFEKRLRDELKFDTTEDLVAQIAQDVIATRQYFNNQESV